MEELEPKKLIFSSLGLLPSARLGSQTQKTTEKEYKAFIDSEFRHPNTRPLQPASRLNQFLFGERFPACSLHHGRADEISAYLPSWTIASASTFNLTEELDALHLTLPKDYFLERCVRLDSDEVQSDTALSAVGLERLMAHCSQHLDIDIRVFMEDEDFSAFVQSQALSENNFEKPLACLVYFQKNKRHATGFYFSKENNTKTVFVFDTMGLTLPAEPCGLRGYDYKIIKQLDGLFVDFQAQKINIAVMPINTALGLQADGFSCLMATLLFFQGMRKGLYQLLNDPGLAEAVGSQTALSKTDAKANTYFLVIYHKCHQVLLYTSTYIPLLTGVQKTLSFLFMLDSLDNANALSPTLIKLRTDWQKKYLAYDDIRTGNVFWQVAYFALLKWFDDVHNGRATAFPDFYALCTQSEPRSEKSEFEERTIELFPPAQEDNPMEAVQSELEQKLREETKRADQERKHDAQHWPYHNYNAEIDPNAISTDVLPYRTVVTPKSISTIVVSQSGRATQEDRALAILSTEDTDFAREFSAMNLQAKVDFLRKKVKALEEKAMTRDKSGTTMTFSLVWTTVDDTTQKIIAHILTAQIGDSLASVIGPGNAVTRLTSEHQLTRLNERKKFEERGFRIESNGTIYKDNQRVGCYVSPEEYGSSYLYGLSGQGLMVSRMLGDKPQKDSSPVFSSEPDLSHHTVEAEGAYLVTHSDGVGPNVSEENIGKILAASPNDLALAGKRIVCLAQDRYNPDNKSVVITALNQIKPGQVLMQIDLDGHNGHEVVDSLVEEIKTIHPDSPDVLWMPYETSPHPLVRARLDEMKKDRGIKTPENVKRCLSELRQLTLTTEMNSLVDAVLSVNEHEKNHEQKYNLLREFGEVIKTFDFQSDEQRINSYRNFIYLALQRNKCGLTNTTDSGWEIHRLLNDFNNVELKQLLFPELKDQRVRYRDIRAFATGIKIHGESDKKTKANEKINEKIFSTKYKGVALGFWTKDNFLTKPIKNLVKDLKAQVKSTRCC